MMLIPCFGAQEKIQNFRAKHFLSCKLRYLFFDQLAEKHRTNPKTASYIEYLRGFVSQVSHLQKIIKYRKAS